MIYHHAISFAWLAEIHYRVVLDVFALRQKIHAQRDRWRTAHRRSQSINTLISHACFPSPFDQLVFIVVPKF